MLKKKDCAMTKIHQLLQAKIPTTKSFLNVKFQVIWVFNIINIMIEKMGF